MRRLIIKLGPRSGSLALRIARGSGNRPRRLRGGGDFSFMVLPSVADRASAMLHDAGDAARDTMTQIADKAASVAEQASHRLRDTIPDQDDRDTYLLGAAALAVAAAVGIAYHHRRAEEGTRTRGH